MEEMILMVAVSAVLFLYPAWRVFKRAGLNPALSLTVLVPYLGELIAGVLLATMSWKIPSKQGAQS